MIREWLAQAADEPMTWGAVALAIAGLLLAWWKERQDKTRRK